MVIKKKATVRKPRKTRASLDMSHAFYPAITPEQYFGIVSQYGWEGPSVAASSSLHPLPAAAPAASMRGGASRAPASMGGGASRAPASVRGGASRAPASMGGGASRLIASLAGASIIETTLVDAGASKAVLDAASAYLALSAQDPQHAAFLADVAEVHAGREPESRENYEARLAGLEAALQEAAPAQQGSGSSSGKGSGSRNNSRSTQDQAGPSTSTASQRLREASARPLPSAALTAALENPPRSSSSSSRNSTRSTQEQAWLPTDTAFGESLSRSLAVPLPTEEVLGRLEWDQDQLFDAIDQAIMQKDDAWQAADSPHSHGIDEAAFNDFLNKCLHNFSPELVELGCREPRALLGALSKAQLMDMRRNFKGENRHQNPKGTRNRSAVKGSNTKAVKAIKESKGLRAFAATRFGQSIWD